MRSVRDDIEDRRRKSELKRKAWCEAFEAEFRIDRREPSPTGQYSRDRVVTLQPTRVGSGDKPIVLERNTWELIKLVADRGGYKFATDTFLTPAASRQLYNALVGSPITLSGDADLKALQAVVALCKQARGLKVGMDYKDISRASLA